MLKIGEFSQLAQVSVKALRHYDDLGLLKPDWIDRFTGYRYYTLQQLPRIHRILTLRELGFPLAQIERLLQTDLSPDELQRLMQMRQAELRERHVAIAKAQVQPASKHDQEPDVDRDDHRERRDHDPCVVESEEPRRGDEN